MRFREKIQEISQGLERHGIGHMLPVMDLEKEQERGAELSRWLVKEHFGKIMGCKALLVVNPGGYIGNSVKVEIGYAKGLKKPVIFLERTGRDELDCLADFFISENELQKIKEIIEKG